MNIKKTDSGNSGSCKVRRVEFNCLDIYRSLLPAHYEIIHTSKIISIQIYKEITDWVALPPRSTT